LDTAMIERVFCCLLIVFCLAEARVVFDNSQVFDEFDFKGQSTVIIVDLCGDSCHIYASITPESQKVASNLLFQLPKGFTSVADIAALVDPVTKQKQYLEVNNTASLTIMNANSQLDAGPVVIYVVKNYGIYRDAEIYEADGLNRPVSNIPQSMTVISARPFTLHQAPLDGPQAENAQGVYATMSGFDSVNQPVCPHLFSLIDGPFPGFTMEVNGPIISLMWNPAFQTPPGRLSATLAITNKRQLERAGFVGSPGYHGCGGKDPYRSSLYDVKSPFHAEITNLEPEDISLDVLTNTDADRAVLLKDADTGAYYIITNTNGNPITANFVNTKNLTIDWTPDGTYNTHFIARWSSNFLVRS
ncbi:hypothetical protein PENTCL1PPCAC_15991, partial [Pristionchus entomophagus]